MLPGLLLLLLTVSGCALPPNLSNPWASCPLPEPGDKAAVQWLKSGSHPITSLTPDASNNKDLTPIGESLGSARVIGLGEATHGTNEFMTLKHRLVQNLVQEHGVTLLAMEAGYSAGQSIDSYINGGPGTAEEALGQMGFWTWNTPEMADLIRWMRTYNATAPASTKLHFAGIDIHPSPETVPFLEQYLTRVAPAMWTEYGEYIRWVGTQPVDILRADPAAQATLMSLRFMSYRMDGGAPDWQQATSKEETDRAVLLVKQLGWYLEAYAVAPPDKLDLRRDEYMSRTLLELLKQAGPDARMAVWAHNAHIWTEEGWMGSYLRKSLGADYYALGLTFGEGEFQAMPLSAAGPVGEVTSYTVAQAPAGFNEWYVGCAVNGDGFIDLRGAPAKGDVAQWLQQPRPTRSFGFAYDPAQPDGVVMQAPLSAYDGVIYVRKTQP
jgi:erythromycin esterase